jgi:hypothetical protein
MRYLFEVPFVVDSSKITERLALRATPVEEALELTAGAGPPTGVAQRRGR